MNLRTILLLLSSLFFLYTNLFGFGKNKVVYKKFNWEILSTPNFDIYYNKGQKLIATNAALILEESAAELSDNLRFELTHVVPVIIYNSHNDFEQSNVIPQLISEGTGGFTEIFKSRIVVPFTGSYAEFRHVLHHELTHAFQYNILLGDFWESLFTRQFMYMPPLYIMEGMAEQQSIGWDNQTEMIIRDAVINNMLVPINRLEMLRLNGYEYYMVYKEGQAFLFYLASQYGKHRIGELIKVFRDSRDITYTFKTVFGKTQYKIYDEWVKVLKKRYWPLIKYKESIEDIAKPLTHHFKDESFYNVKPVWSPDGRYIAFMTDKHIFTSIILIDSETGKEIRKIVQGGRSENFEEMHTRENSLSWSGDGRYLVFISKAGQYDKINIYDFRKNKVVRQLNPKMDSLLSPAVSPNNKFIAFGGVKNGKEDIYIISFDGKNLLRLTDDVYFDTYPVWSPDGKYIIFTSNRDKGYLSKYNEIFALNVKTKKIIKIVSSSGVNISPVISRDGKLMAFVSDRDNYFNIYLKRVYNFKNPEKLISEDEYKITDVITGVFSPSFSPDNKKLVFSGYNKMGQDIFRMKIPEEFYTNKSLKLTDSISNKSDSLQSAFNLNEDSKKSGYSLKFTPDWITGGFAYSSSYGFGGFTQLGFSDILGNHLFMLATDFLSGNNDFNFNLVYYYLAYRLNMGLALFHLKDYYFYSYDVTTYDYSYSLYYLRRYGINLLAQYPFSKFFRADMEILSMKYIKHYDDTPEDNIDVNINTATVSFIYDNILWGETGPIYGFRGRLLFQKSLNITSKDWFFDMAYLDLRKYFLMYKKYTFAIDFKYGSVWGKDSEKNKFHIGGFNTVRGHKYYAYSGKRMGLLNFEYRYPFINIIQIAWPFTFNIRNLRALFFLDMGTAFDNIKKWRFGYNDGRFKFLDLKSGLGWGIRFGIGYYRFRIDWATPWDGSSIKPLKYWQGVFSIGYDF